MQRHAAFLGDGNQQILDAAQRRRQAFQQFGGLRDNVLEPRLGAAIGAHPFLDQGPRQQPHVDRRVELPPHALDQDHSLLQQQQLRLRLHLKLLGHLEQLRQEPAERNLAHRPAEDRLADGARRLGESVERLVARHVAGLEMHLGDAAIVAVEERDQHVGEKVTRGAVEPPHDAEIDRDQRAVRIDEQIARMQVGVEETVAEHLIEEVRGGARQKVAQVEARRQQSGAIVDAKPADPLQRQHGARGPRPIDPRHAETVVAREIRAQFVRGGGFEAQIHFDPHRLAQRIHHLDRLEAPQTRLPALGQVRQPVEQVEVAGHRRRDARTQNLDRDRIALAGAGEMNLGN